MTKLDYSVVNVDSKFDIFTKEDLPNGKLIVIHKDGVFETSKKQIDKTIELVNNFENDKSRKTK